MTPCASLALRAIVTASPGGGRAGMPGAVRKRLTVSRRLTGDRERRMTTCENDAGCITRSTHDSISYATEKGTLRVLLRVSCPRPMSRMRTESPASFILPRAISSSLG